MQPSSLSLTSKFFHTPHAKAKQKHIFEKYEKQKNLS